MCSGLRSAGCKAHLQLAGKPLEGGEQGGRATRTPLLAPRGPGTEEPAREAADSSRAGGSGEGEPLGLRWGRPVLRSLPFSLRRLEGPRRPGSAAACLPAVLSGSTSARHARWTDLHGGSTPFLSSAGHVPLASPSQLGEGPEPAEAVPLREWSFPAGAGGTSEVAADLDGQEGPGKSPPSQAARQPQGGRCAWGGAACGARAHLERWRLARAPACSARLQAGWRVPSPLPVPAQPDWLREPGRAEWTLPAELDLTGERKALPPRPGARPSQALSPQFLLASGSPPRRSSPPALGPGALRPEGPGAERA